MIGAATLVERKEGRRRAADAGRARASRLTRALAMWVLASVLVLMLGAAEDCFGKTDLGDVYGSDAVQYLDCARAMGRGDWHAALNPLWSQGYPALIALLRPVFPGGPWGDWDTVRSLNFAIYAACWGAFCWLVRELLRARAKPLSRTAAPLLAVAAAGIFLTTQLSIGQVSRVGPDELVAAIFFAACALLLRLTQRPELWAAVALGCLLGVGFLVKAAFLVMGACFLAVAALALARRRAGPGFAGVAVLLFAAITGSYGAALSARVGHVTLGEAGAINYAWHVNRLAKWVHWEGGVDTADKAWPKASLARFAHWQTDPPDFGRPLHPSAIDGGSPPRIFVFHEPVTATYVPYYDPPYWYAGYRHLFRWRYQVIALAKSVADLAQLLVRQPFLYALALVLVLLGPGPVAAGRLRRLWPLGVCACVSIAIFLPVHLEGRYLTGALAVLCLLALMALLPERAVPAWREWACVLLLVSGAGIGIVKSQRETWARAAQRWSPADNVQWRTGTDVTAAGVGPGAQVGMISWQPNLECDWAYIAGLQITSEIEDGADERAFWALPAARQQAVLARFRRAGATAVLTWDQPQGSAAGWTQLPGSTMWMHRL